MFIYVYPKFVCPGSLHRDAPSKNKTGVTGVSNGEGDAESVKAWHLLERSHNTFWQLQYGNMSHSEAP